MFVRATLLASCALGLATAAHAQEPSPVWHYWGAGAELEAITSLIDLNNENYADTPVVGEVIPGNTVELRRQLQTAMLGGNPPAAYQSAMGYEIKTFVDAGQLKSVQDVWDEVDGSEIFPSGLQRVMKVDGVPYAIPLNMAVISNIFYNKELFDDNGWTAPQTFDELKALCDEVEATGIACFANGAGSFWSLYNFYAPLISVVGTEGYFKLASGEMPFDGPEFREALKLYGEVYAANYIENWGGKTWAQGGEDVVAGRAAMYQMGDWISGYFQELGWAPGEDYDFFPAPGVDGAVVIQVDAIATPNGTEASEAAAANFLRTSASAEGQAAFNRYKGSVAANLQTSDEIYDYIGKKTSAEVASANETDAVMPNLFFLLPTELGTELGVQLERFAADPSDATIDSVVETLEALRQDALSQESFVSW
ncbi:ABC transporter substrate-binding protein [uncultured Martelella sp.]|uniref:ABC transporter substrate-binding protein n=1 Tax=uncultured Martelella sp. TaxID=392331 RepID=UPI0029C7C5DD|nr:ABC transporter substrate-binding protein [uncultured Martelella sp.]